MKYTMNSRLRHSATPRLWVAFLITYMICPGFGLVICEKTCPGFGLSFGFHGVHPYQKNICSHPNLPRSHEIITSTNIRTTHIRKHACFNHIRALLNRAMTHCEPLRPNCEPLRATSTPLRATASHFDPTASHCKPLRPHCEPLLPRCKTI